MERVSRRKILAAGTSAAVASALVGASTAAAQVRSTRPPGQPLMQWLERYALSLNLQASDALRTPSSPTVAPTGPAYFTGTIWDDGGVGPDGTPVQGAIQRGVYRAFAWVYVPGAAPQFTAIHSFDLFGRGQITASGVTDISVAITGGTGEFQGIRGEIRAANIGTTGNALTLDIDAIGPSVGM
jgi:hypothetical protein